jgi:hypothetical protein
MVINKEPAKSIKKENIKINILSLVFLLLGVFSTTPIITIKFLGNHISLFTLLFFVATLLISILFIKRMKITIGKTSKLLVLWLVLSIFSTLFGILFFYNDYPEWATTAQSYLPKIMIYIYFIFMLSSTSHSKIIIESFIKGFIVGCVLNILWSNVEGIVYYSLGFSLNNLVFNDYAVNVLVNRPYITGIYADGIRTPGFNFDPVHMGGIIPIILIYALKKKNNLVVLLCLTSLAFSQSTTGLVTSMMLLIIFYRNNIFKVLKVRSFKVRISAFVTGIILMGILLIFTINFGTQIFNSIETNVSGFIARSTNVYIRNEEPSIRTKYHLCLPNSIYFNGIKTLTGTGFGTASFPYVFNDYVRAAIGIKTIKPYDPESVYISYLFDTGVFGLTVYLLFLWKIIKILKRDRNNETNFFLLASSNMSSISKSA